MVNVNSFTYYSFRSLYYYFFEQQLYKTMNHPRSKLNNIELRHEPVDWFITIPANQINLNSGSPAFINQTGNTKKRCLSKRYNKSEVADEPPIATAAYYVPLIRKTVRNKSLIIQ